VNCSNIKSQTASHVERHIVHHGTNTNQRSMHMNSFYSTGKSIDLANFLLFSIFFCLLEFTYFIELKFSLTTVVKERITAHHQLSEPRQWRLGPRSRISTAFQTSAPRLIDPWASILNHRWFHDKLQVVCMSLKTLKLKHCWQSINNSTLYTHESCLGLYTTALDLSLLWPVIPLKFTHIPLLSMLQSTATALYMQYI